MLYIVAIMIYSSSFVRPTQIIEESLDSSRSWNSNNKMSFKFHQAIVSYECKWNALLENIRIQSSAEL